MVIFSNESTSMTLLVERGFNLAKTLVPGFNHQDWADLESK